MNEVKKDWLNPKELHEEFGISITKQNRYRREKKIPFTKLGNATLYKRVQIESWLDDNRVV